MCEGDDLKGKGVPSGAEGLEVRMVLIAVEMRSPALYVDRLMDMHYIRLIEALHGVMLITDEVPC